MRDVCHSPPFFMSLIIRFISSPLPSGRLKAFFSGLWGFGPNKAKDAAAHKHTHEGTAELSLVRGKCNHKGLIIQTQTARTWTHTPQHTEPGALSLAGHCIVGLCGQSLHEWLSSVFLDQVFDDECVFDHRALSDCLQHACASVRRRVFGMFVCVCVHFDVCDICAFCAPAMSPCWLCRSLNEAAYSCPCLWETIVGLVQWRDACLGKGCKVMGKESFVSGGVVREWITADVFMA